MFVPHWGTLYHFSLRLEHRASLIMMHKAQLWSGGIIRQSLPILNLVTFSRVAKVAPHQERRFDAPPTASGLPPIINGHYQTGRVGPFGAISRQDAFGKRKAKYCTELASASLRYVSFARRFRNVCSRSSYRGRSSASRTLSHATTSTGIALFNPRSQSSTYTLNF